VAQAPLATPGRTGRRVRIVGAFDRFNYCDSLFAHLSERFD